MPSVLYTRISLSILYNVTTIDNSTGEDLTTVYKFGTAILILTVGASAGWWLRDNYAPSNKYHGSTFLKPVNDGALAVITPTAFVEPPVYRQPPATKELLALLEDRRFDDAITLFQQHNNSDASTQQALRHSLITLLEQWRNNGESEKSIQALERFTQHYYQDSSLLKMQVEMLISQGEIHSALEVCMMAEPLTRRGSSTEFFKRTTQHLARQLISNHKKNNDLASLLPLFQRLVHRFPHYSLYRYHLAEIYLAASLANDAARELEQLTDDPVFGKVATALLADFTVATMDDFDEPETLPTGSVPLTPSGAHFMANVMIGDKVTAALLIDTGATLTTLPPALLQKLKGLKLAARSGHTELKTANGIRFAPIYRLKTLQIGAFVLNNLEVAELEIGGNEPAQGLLGMNILNRFMFQIDQDRKALMLIPR
ncbi:retropepsin-like aspartic protease [Candidatus Sororendozoicomonas aggregata]|uniref:retropepsin-like aspartic protease n=1 Tax=Candidatus Sororendozoicomonas aggregata TaxID=3073239 RepID=UPI002ED44BCE